MKKILTKTVLFAAMVALILSSCRDKNDYPDIPPVNGERTVALRIVDAATRSTAPVPAGTPVVLNEGNIYLVNAGGTIVRHFTIAPANDAVTTLTPENLAAGIIHRNLLGDGVLLPSVPDNTTEVVVVGNTPNSNHTGNVDGDLIGGRLIDIVTQYDIQNVNLFGRRALPLTPSFEGVFPVSVHLSPTVARLELPSISGAGMIAGFTVEGIFINHYHQSASIGGVIPGINSEPNLINHTEVENFAYNAPGTSYTTASNNALFYWNATANEGAGFYKRGLTVRPSNRQTSVFHPATGQYATRNHVWGFQLFAGNYGESGAPETYAPRLVIRVNNIRLTDGRIINAPRFVTVGGFFRRQGEDLVSVTHIRAGNVYHVVGGIVFNHNDLAIVPNENVKDVEVSLTLAVWDGDEWLQGGFQQPNPMASISAVQHTFELDAAICNYCLDGEISYLWQQRIVGSSDWVDAVPGTGNHTSPHFTTPVLGEEMEFRRRAVCSCNTDRVIYTDPARVSISGVVAVTGVSISVGVSPGFSVWEGQNFLSDNHSVALTAAIMPSDATNQNVTWSSSHPHVVSVAANGVITATPPHTWPWDAPVIITVTTEDGGFSHEFRVFTLVGGGMP